MPLRPGGSRVYGPFQSSLPKQGEGSSLSASVRVGCVLTPGCTAEALGKHPSTLNNDEHGTYERFAFDPDRRDYAIAHALLRTMLSEALPAILPADWRFVRSSQGRPSVSPDLVPTVHFSLS